MNIPFLSFKFHNEIRAELQKASNRVIDSGWFINGKEVAAFEEEWAQYLGCQSSIGVSNGLDALILSLKALGIGSGDEVIVPSNTYVATALAATHVGATPVFVEPNKETYNIEPERIEAAISNKTKAIMPVHLYGQAAEMTAIMQLASKHWPFRYRGQCASPRSPTQRPKNRNVWSLQRHQLLPWKEPRGARRCRSGEHQ